MSRPALFLDRDGVLNVDSGFVHRWDDWVWIPGAREVIEAFNAAGWAVVVVTNQSGVARGFYSEADIEALHAAVQDSLTETGAHIDAFYHCPFHHTGTEARYLHPDHPDRKPNPGMLLRAAADLSLDLAASILIGDRQSDLDAARAAGVRGYLFDGSDLAKFVRTLQTGPHFPLPTRFEERPFMTQDLSTLDGCRAHALHWLTQEAAPIWGERGMRDNGFFVERIALDGTPTDLPLRLRVQARQVYSFAAAGALGWTGPWRQLVETGVEVLITKGRREDGLFIHGLNADGSVRDSHVDLYDHAFVLFSLAHAGKALDRPDLFDVAESVMDRLEADWTRPEGGFWEGDAVVCPPYRQNPHMHTLEAALAHFAASGRPRWRALADRIGGLVKTKFIDKSSGALLEYFNQDWTPQAGEPGQIVEPGHCFEWAWLLETGFPDGSGAPYSDGLVAFARAHGIDHARGVAINEVLLDGSVRDGGARLWPQTERLKAAAARYRRTGAELDLSEIIAAYQGLVKYFDTPTKGLWRDRLNLDGSWVEEAAPASSFYHIVCAIGELLA